MPVCGSGAFVRSSSQLFVAIIAAIRQKLHLIPLFGFAELARLLEGGKRSYARPKAVWLIIVAANGDLTALQFDDVT